MIAGHHRCASSRDRGGYAGRIRSAARAYDCNAIFYPNREAKSIDTEISPDGARFMLIAGNWMWHLSPLVVMFGMVTLNHLIMHHRMERRYALEADRLRSALLAELRALHKVYMTNLELIDSKAGYVVSTRSVAAVYRGNLPRLTSLFEPPVIEPLVTWFAENEALEGKLAAQATSKGGISYQLTPET